MDMHPDTWTCTEHMDRRQDTWTCAETHGHAPNTWTFSQTHGHSPRHMDMQRDTWTFRRIPDRILRLLLWSCLTLSSFTLKTHVWRQWTIHTFCIVMSMYNVRYSTWGVVQHGVNVQRGDLNHIHDKEICIVQTWLNHWFSLCTRYTDLGRDLYRANVSKIASRAYKPIQGTATIKYSGVR
jgi:hypothetical protein